jgi:GT2 family glycosyltransferase
MELSIIILNYETFNLTKQSIESIISKNYSFSHEIIVVDNNSKDGSYEQLESCFKRKKYGNTTIKFILNLKNYGFAKGNNIAIKKAKGNFILLLNSDTCVKENSIEECLYYIKKHDNVGAIGCKVILPNGELDKASKRSFPDPKTSFYRLFGLSKLFPNNDKFNSYNLSYLDDNGIYEVDSLVGAFMLLKKETIKEVGLLDEDFFMYGEDIDLCYRIKEKGWKVIYYGKVDIIHYKGSSSAKQKSKMIYEFYKAMYIFYNKHYKKKYSFVLTIFIYIGIGILFLTKLLLNTFKFNK